MGARRQMLKVLYPIKEVPKERAGRKRNTKQVDMPNKLFTEILLLVYRLHPYEQPSVLRLLFHNYPSRELPLQSAFLQFYELLLLLLLL